MTDKEMRKMITIPYDSSFTHKELPTGTLIEAKIGSLTVKGYLLWDANVGSVYMVHDIAKANGGKPHSSYAMAMWDRIRNDTGERLLYGYWLGYTGSRGTADSATLMDTSTHHIRKIHSYGATELPRPAAVPAEAVPSTETCITKETHMSNAEYSVKALGGAIDEAIKVHETAIAEAMKSATSVIDKLAADFKKTGKAQFSEEPVAIAGNDDGLVAKLTSAKKKLALLAGEAVKLSDLGVDVPALCERAGTVSSIKRTISIGAC